jgi:hypothetical protein
MSEFESSSADQAAQPAPVLGYATPVAPRKSLEILRQTICFALVQFGIFVGLTFLSNGPAFLLDFLMVLLLLIGVASLGFSAALLVLRPAVREKRWQLVISGVAAAATVAAWWGMSHMAGRFLTGLFGYGSFWIIIAPDSLALMATSFVTNSIVLLVCKQIFAKRA